MQGCITDVFNPDDVNLDIHLSDHSTFSIVAEQGIDETPEEAVRGLLESIQHITEVEGGKPLGKPVSCRRTVNGKKFAGLKHRFEEGGGTYSRSICSHGIVL